MAGRKWSYLVRWFGKFFLQMLRLSVVWLWVGPSLVCVWFGLGLVWVWVWFGFGSVNWFGFLSNTFSKLMLSRNKIIKIKGLRTLSLTPHFRSKHLLKLSITNKLSKLMFWGVWIWIHIFPIPQTFSTLIFLLSKKKRSTSIAWGLWIWIPICSIPKLS